MLDVAVARLAAVWPLFANTARVEPLRRAFTRISLLRSCHAYRTYALGCGLNRTQRVRTYQYCRSATPRLLTWLSLVCPLSLGKVVTYVEFAALEEDLRNPISNSLHFPERHETHPGITAGLSLRLL